MKSDNCDITTTTVSTIPTTLLILQQNYDTDEEIAIECRQKFAAFIVCFISTESFSSHRMRLFSSRCSSEIHRVHMLKHIDNKLWTKTNKNALHTQKNGQAFETKRCEIFDRIEYQANEKKENRLKFCANKFD